MNGDLPVSNVWLNSSEHVDAGLVESDKHSIMQLSESQESQNPDDLGVQFVDTSDPYHEGKLGLSRDIERSCQLCCSPEFKFLLLGVLVVLKMCLRSLKHISPLGLIVNSPLLSGLLQSLSILGISLLLLLEGFWLWRGLLFDSHLGLGWGLCGHNNLIILEVCQSLIEIFYISDT